MSAIAGCRDTVRRRSHWGGFLATLSAPAHSDMPFQEVPSVKKASRMGRVMASQSLFAS